MTTKVSPLCATILLLLTINGYRGVSAEQNRTDANSGDNKARTEHMADYELIPLDRLIGIAQLIVLGEVIKVEDATFTLRVNGTIAGKAFSPEIEILQFTPGQFDGGRRPVPYAAGQSFLLFLTKDEKNQGQKHLRILGLAGEGELPVEGGFVYLRGASVEGVRSDSYRVQGVAQTSQRFDAEGFNAAVKSYRSCFEWKPARLNRPEPVMVCDETALEQMRNVSDLHKHVVRLTVRRLGKR